MFREMRRKRQQLTVQECRDILSAGTTAVLGVQGDDGYPYTVPVNYFYDGEKIYFHGAKAGHKFDALVRCPKVSLCVIAKEDLVPQELTTYFRSVIVFGKARILVDEDEIYQTTMRFGQRYLPDPARVEQSVRSSMKALCCVEITVEHMTGKEAIELTRMRGGSHPGGEG